MAKRKKRFTDTFLSSAGVGALQGGTLNYADEIARLVGADDVADALTAAERENPVAFGVGNLAGTALTGFGGTMRAVKGLKGLPFLKKAALIDGTIASVAGAGGYDPAARESLDERAKMAALTGAVGAASAGLVPAAFSGANQLRLNAPVLRGKPALHADQDLIPASGWTPQRMVDEALARDEALRRAGKDARVFGPYGKEARPLDADGPNVRSLFDVAMRDETAASLFGKATDQTYRAGLREQIKELRTYANTKVPKAGVDAPKPTRANADVAALREDLLAALDDDMAHPEWTKLAHELRGADEKAAYKFAGRLLAIMDARIERATGDELVQLAQRMQRTGDIAEKLRALGVEATGAAQTLKRADLARRRGQEAATAGRQPRNERRPQFSSADDNINVRLPRQREGKGAPAAPDDAPDIALRDYDAALMMQELLRQRRMNYVPPSRAADPLFDVKPRAGAKWENPFLAANPAVAKAGYVAGKFAPPAVDQLVSGHGLSYLPPVVRDMLESRRERTAGNRWLPGRAA
jgi:hypothetical protein